MMSTIKYTKDGKKVSVVGKLNNTDWIVTEIYVSEDGAEIPAGENFIVKSLLDSPVESWKKKHLRELNAKFDSDREALERRLKDQSNRLNMEYKKMVERTKYIKELSANEAISDQLGTLIDFMTGRITYAFVDCAFSPKIVTIDDNAFFDIDSWGGSARMDGLKLVSLFGKSGGSLEYRVNQYRDGSGSSWKTIRPCRSYNEALAFAQDRLNELCKQYVEAEKGHSVSLDKWEKIEGIVIPDDAKEKSEKSRVEQVKARIEKLDEERKKLESEI